MTTPSRPIGHLLREWRSRRRLSQFELARDTDISPSHLSSLESGRVAPGRDTLLNLAERLAVPLRERNAMLDAAGLPSLYSEKALDDPGSRMTRRTIDLILSGREPNPAVAIDRHWTVTASNRAVDSLISGVVPMLLTPPVNLIRLSLHPAGLAPRIINLEQWRRHLIGRLRRQTELSADPVLLDLIAEVRAYPLLSGTAREPAGADIVAVPLRLATVHGPMAFFNTTTVFGGPTDITLAEIAIEAFFPADSGTVSLMRRMAAMRAPAPSAVRAVRRAPRAAAG